MNGSSAPRLTISVRGPAVGPAQLAVRDLIEILGRTEQALKRIAEARGTPAPGRRGRKVKAVEEQCRLHLVSWAAGSAVAGLTLGTPNRPDLFNEVGQESLDALIDHFQWLGRDQPPSPWPPFLIRGALEAYAALGQALDRGIDEIRFTAYDRSHRCAAFTPKVRERVREMLILPDEPGRERRTGRLDVLNAHAGLEGRLWEPVGTRWTCKFHETVADLLPNAWRRTVTVVGIVNRAKHEIIVEALLIDDADGEATSSAAPPFWEETSLPELESRQQVGAIARIEELTAAWSSAPLDDDPLADVLEERRRRRAAVRSTA